MQNTFIGIFDSGIGGLTVYQDIKQKLPNEQVVYLADTINCPYGTKTIEEVKNITLKNINYLKNLGAKVIVIACNTATSSIIDEIKKSDGYLLGVVEPTANLAKKVSKTKQIGLFATNLTVESKVYDHYLKDVDLYAEKCSDFVLPIEKGQLHTKQMKEMIKKHLAALPNIDTLILGCTHFPYIKDEIEQFILKSVTIVESGKPTAEKLSQYLVKQNRLNNFSDGDIFLTTGKISDLEKNINKFKFKEIKQVEIN